MNTGTLGLPVRHSLPSPLYLHLRRIVTIVIDDSYRAIFILM
jgi:hypothetical protein